MSIESTKFRIFKGSYLIDFYENLVIVWKVRVLSRWEEG